MAQTRQRRREVARAKWERQQARREVAARRARRLRIAGTVLAVIVVVGLITWLVVTIVQKENGSDQPPVNPIPTNITPSVITPSGPSTPPASSGASPTNGARTGSTHSTKGAK